MTKVTLTRGIGCALMDGMSKDDVKDELIAAALEAARLAGHRTQMGRLAAAAQAYEDTFDVVCDTFKPFTHDGIMYVRDDCVVCGHGLGEHPDHDKYIDTDHPGNW